MTPTYKANPTFRTIDGDTSECQLCGALILNSTRPKDRHAKWHNNLLNNLMRALTVAGYTEGAPV
jgi:hypothetical protein